MPIRVCKNCERDISHLDGRRRYCDECRDPEARRPTVLTDDLPDYPDVPDYPLITIRWDNEIGMPVVDIGEDLHPLMAYVMVSRAAEKLNELIPDALMSWELE